MIALRVRTRDLRADEARAAFSHFDSWCAQHTQLVAVESADIAAAMDLMRRLDLSLRTPDAIHLAVAQRMGCMLLTFDGVMARTARAIGVGAARG